MPRIEPIPMDQLADEPRRIIEEGVADGTYATPVPLQIFAYRTAQIIQTNMARQAWGKPCMQSRKHDSITDEDVACLISPGHSDLTEQERLAVEFLDLLSADHHAIDDETYRRLGEVFTAAQIIELGFTCATSMGTHRFIHTLDPFGTAPPVIPFDPDQVDAAYADAETVQAEV